jgi:hypothetical protein
MKCMIYLKIVGRLLLLLQLGVPARCLDLADVVLNDRCQHLQVEGGVRESLLVLQLDISLQLIETLVLNDTKQRYDHHNPIEDHKQG